MCLHTIQLDPSDPEQMWVAVSAAGVFFTENNGRTWVPRNQGIRAEFLPDHYPEVGQCVHKLVAHPTNPHIMYLQNHVGVYRTSDGGKQWHTIETGLPAVFGFPILVHPQEPDTVFVVPLVSAEERYMPEGKPAVYRSRDSGQTWERLRTRLPTSNAWLNVFRQAFVADTLDPSGLYFGTSTGQLFASVDVGESWTLLADFLPPILSVRVTVN